MNKFLPILLSLFTISLFAQLKPQKNDFGIGIDYKFQKEVLIVTDYDVWGGISNDYRLEQYNFFPALKFDYFLKDELSLNLFFRPVIISKSDIDEQISPNKSFRDYKINKFSMSLGFGLEKHFFKKLKIDPFVGVNIHYIYSARENIVSKNKSYDYQLNYLRSVTSNDTKGVEVHGFNSTINFGMNYFISPNFSLGANLDLGYRYVLQKGTAYFKSERTSYNQAGDVIETQNNKTDYKYNNKTGDFIYSFSIKTAFYFSLKKKKNKSSAKG